MSMASRLKEARKFRGYTQEALAKAVGVSRGVISNIEYEKAAPQALVIRAICEVLHINELWLTEGDGEMESDSGQKNAQLLYEIYNSAKELSEGEQDYILHLIKIFRKYRCNFSDHIDKV